MQGAYETTFPRQCPAATLGSPGGRDAILLGRPVKNSQERLLCSHIKNLRPILNTGLMSTQLVMLSKVLQRYNGLKLMSRLKSSTPPILTSKMIIANTPRLLGIDSNANFPKQISLA